MWSWLHAVRERGTVPGHCCHWHWGRVLCRFPGAGMSPGHWPGGLGALSPSRLHPPGPGPGWASCCVRAWSLSLGAFGVSEPADPFLSCDEFCSWEVSRFLSEGGTRSGSDPTTRTTSRVLCCWLLRGSGAAPCRPFLRGPVRCGLRCLGSPPCPPTPPPAQAPWHTQSWLSSGSLGASLP